MSELIQKNDNRATIRWKLLTGASALALAAYVSSASLAKAEDASRPQVWIELGGQLNRLQDIEERFEPSFLALTPSIFTPPQKTEKPPLYGLDETAALTFQPEGSDWIFSASIRYGRASSARHVHQQTYPSSFVNFVGVLIPPLANRFADAKTKQSEDHAIIDFQAGKDLGLGLLGHNTSSSLSVGVRIAQFGSTSRATLAEDPDWALHSYHRTLHIGPRTIIIQSVHQPYHTFVGEFEAERSFHGIGPSLSWKSSTPFAGNTEDGALTLDWGVNASLLFGRQRTRTQHDTTAQFHPRGAGVTDQPGRYQLYHHPTDAPAYYSTRSRNVTVPNVGGFAGISFNYDDAKVSFGYKADFFFGAIDGGIDTRKDENRAFYGPYASISIGLGD
jgi:hypothetical protein